MPRSRALAKRPRRLRKSPASSAISPKPHSAGHSSELLAGHPVRRRKPRPDYRGCVDPGQSTVAVMLVKQGERLQVFLNKAKVFESDKAIPAGFLFNQLSLDHDG